MEDAEARVHDAVRQTPSLHPVDPIKAASHGRSVHSASGLLGGMSHNILRIYTLGRFEVLLLSSADQPRRLPLTGKVHLLLTCLLSAPDGYVAREQLMELLWPEQSMRQARDSLRHSLSRLRRILAPDPDPSGPSSYLGSDRGGVWLHVAGLEGSSGGSEGARGAQGARRIWVDSHRFEALASAALRVLGRGRAACDGQTVAAARTAADEALALHQGPFLPTDRQIEWTDQRRLHLLTLWTALVQARAELAVVEQDLRHAALLVSELLQADPEDEEAAGRLMCIQAAQGRRSEALRVYQRLCAYMTANEGAKPTQELQELERAIRASESLQDLRLLLVRHFMLT